MGGTPERSTTAQGAQRIAEMFAEGLSDGNIGIVDGIYWKEDADKPVIVTLNVSSKEKARGGTQAEKDFGALLLLRAKIAGSLHEYSPEVTILYEAGLVSIPDNGVELIAKLVAGYNRTQIPAKA